MKLKLSSLEKKWILYDVGNSAFILMVSTILPIYFNELCIQGGLTESQYITLWSYAIAFSTILVAFLGPVIGTIADFKGYKKIFYIALAFGGCALLVISGMPAQWFYFLLCFMVTRIFYALSLVVYDSMLSDISSEENIDYVSSAGYAWGYFGSVVPFIGSLILALFYDKFGLSFNEALFYCFFLNAAWWFVFSLPLALSYRQKNYIQRPKRIIASSFSRLKNTFVSIRHQKKVFIFLLAFFFYIDGVYTIIEMATAYGTSLGLGQTGLLLALLMTQIVAFPASITFGVLSKKYKPTLLIKICIIAYLGIAIFAFFLAELWQFWVLAFLVGLFQGGIQALSRSYYARIIPENASGEYFGLFDICGKGASFLGTFLVGLVTQITGQQNIAVGALAILFIAGYFLFYKAAAIPDKETTSAKA